METSEQPHAEVELRSACEKVQSARATLVQANADNDRASVPEHTFDERPGAANAVRDANAALADHVPTIMTLLGDVARLRDESSAGGVTGEGQIILTREFVRNLVNELRHVSVFTANECRFGPVLEDLHTLLDIGDAIGAEASAERVRMARKGLAAAAHAIREDAAKVKSTDEPCQPDDMKDGLGDLARDIERMSDEELDRRLGEANPQAALESEYEQLLARAYVLAPHLSNEERWICQARHAAAHRRGGEPPVLTFPEEPAVDERPWCWRKPNAETCEGPFDSRDDAIHDARHGWGWTGPMEVGRCTPLLDMIGVPDLEYMVDRINDLLGNDGYEASVTFDPDLSDEASDELHAWAMKYITAKSPGEWWLADGEDVSAVDDDDEADE